MTRLGLSVDMAALRTAARSDVDSVFAARLAAIMSPMSVLHTRKAQEADRILDVISLRKAAPLAVNVGSDTSALLAAEAKRRSLSQADLAKLIVAKRDGQNTTLGALEADRQAAHAAIDSAQTPADLDIIMEPYR